MRMHLKGPVLFDYAVITLAIAAAAVGMWILPATMAIPPEVVIFGVSTLCLLTLLVHQLTEHLMHHDEPVDPLNPLRATWHH